MMGEPRIWWVHLALVACLAVCVQAKQYLKQETFESFEEYEAMFSSERTFQREAATVPPSSIVWPQFVPPGPFYFDTQCFGRFVDFCPKAGKFCKWYTQSDPTCYDTRFVSVTIPPCQVENSKSVPLHVKFFQFNWGVHLVEGTFIKRFYSLTVDECALKCLESANGFIGLKRDRLKCVSFDFYPFEVWMAQPPYNEAQDRGICVLNNESKDTARMRNEDQGLTDAELYYKSHASYRPFSPLDGYYEVRNPRGVLTPLLEYAGPASLGMESPWGGSRWGMYHPNLPGYIPQPLNTTLACGPSSSSDPPPPPEFRGGFTPVDDDQKCPGLMTKDAARALCTRMGGSLCVNQTELNLISGRKLGCSFDQSGQGNIWSEADNPALGLRYPRCCSSYYLPLNNIIGGTGGTCEPYEAPNIKFCSQFTSTTSCLYSHRPNDTLSQYRQSWLLGFGHGLDDIRDLCATRVANDPNYNCTGMDLGGWTTKTNCIWCPQAGLLPVGGNGQCRPGGSYGICPTASEEQKQIFAIRIRSACAAKTNCDLIAAYPDLLPYMGNVTFDINIGEDSSKPPTTISPTKTPTKKTPTTTSYPTTRYPTQMSKSPSSASPVSNSPSAAPTYPSTFEPTRQPTTAFPTPPTRRATKGPTAKPTRTPTSVRGTSSPSIVLPDFGNEEEE